MVFLMTRTLCSCVRMKFCSFFFPASQSNVTSRYCIWSDRIGLVSFFLFEFCKCSGVLTGCVCSEVLKTWCFVKALHSVQVSPRSGHPSAFSLFLMTMFHLNLLGGLSECGTSVHQECAIRGQATLCSLS